MRNAANADRQMVAEGGDLNGGNDVDSANEDSLGSFEPFGAQDGPGSHNSWEGDEGDFEGDEGWEE